MTDHPFLVGLLSIILGITLYLGVTDPYVRPEGNCTVIDLTKASDVYARIGEKNWIWTDIKLDGDAAEIIVCVVGRPKR